MERVRPAVLPEPLLKFEPVPDDLSALFSFIEQTQETLPPPLPPIRSRNDEARRLELAAPFPELFRLAARNDAHPILRAVELHYNLAATHPFEDGNGRTARLMMNLLLLQAGFPLPVVTIEQRSEYLAALDEANAGRWLTFATLIAERVFASLRDFE